MTATLIAGVLSGCELKESTPNLASGKQAFNQRCASCHTLRRAGAAGVSGPNLDASFARALNDGMKRNTIRGIVHNQILYPNRRSQIDPKTRKATIAMPARLVTGETAKDVAAYVAEVAAKAGEDPPQLSTAGANP